MISNLNRSLAWVSFVLFLPCVCVAQEKPRADEPVGIFQTRAEYEQFMGGVKEIAYSGEGSAELRAMIPLLNDIVLDQPIGSTAARYNDQRSSWGMLSDSKIRAELAMADEQFEELSELQKAVREQAIEQVRQLDFSDRDLLAQQIQTMRNQMQEKMDSFLLPHQQQRLRQIRMQAQLRRRSLVDILTSDPFKTELEISTEQSQELREAEKRIEKDIQEQIAKLRQEARQRLLSTLQPDQRREVEEMLGDAFEFDSKSKLKTEKKPNRVRKD